MEKRKSTIYAVDFGGTLCENKWPDINEFVLNIAEDACGAIEEYIEELMKKEVNGEYSIAITPRLNTDGSLYIKE